MTNLSPPSETSGIDLEKDKRVNACLRVMDFFELDFEDIGNDKTKFLKA